MPLVLADRVRDTTTTTGTGTVTLSGTAPSGYQNFSVVGNGNTTYYTINAGSQWEVGIGTYSSTGPTLARTTVLASSNSGSLVDFSAGTKDVFVTYPAGESVYQDGASIAAGTAVLGVANGGTGTSTAFTAGSVVFAGASGVYSQDNANLFWDNANDRLGIGTSIPGYRLTLIGTDTTNALISGVTRGVRFAFNSTTSRIEGVDNTGAASYQPLDINGSILTMSISATERMRITSAGSVGIGTSAPARLFEVTATGTNIPARLGNSQGNLDIGGSDGVVVNIDTRSWAMGLQTGGTERMRITTAGLVGIGTSAPAELLDVNAATTSTGYTDFVVFRQVNGAGTHSRILFGQNATNNMFIEVANQANTKGNLLLQPFGGNVGVGTGSPAFNLDVTGTGRFTGLTQFDNDITLNKATLNYLYFNDALAFARNGVGERMRIDTSGNVGIGTSSPGTRLQVRDAAAPSGFSSTAVRVSRDNYGADFIGYIDQGVGYGAIISTVDNGTPTERMRITSAGNVGIGISSPSSRLTVQGDELIIPTAGWTSGQAARLYLGDTNNGVQSVNGSYQTYFAFNGHSWNVNGSEAMRIDGSRNVGIGTSTPGYRLDVSGVINTNAAVRMTPTNVGAFTRAQLQSAYNLDGTGASVFTWNYTNGGGELDLFINRNGGGTGGLKIYDFPNTSGNPTNIFTVEGGGNVGIGTASPATSLSVVTNTTSHIGVRVTNNSTTQFAGSGLQMLGPSAAGTQGGAAIYYYNSTVGGTQGAMAMAQLDSNGSFQRNIAYYDFNGQSWGFATNSTERMRIDSSGNVGIGTSVPGATLDVAGTIRTSAGGSDPGTGTVLYFVGSGSFQSVIAGAAFAVHTGNNNARTERMRIDINGNAGIGTSSPGAKLDVTTASGANIVVSRSSAAGYAAFQRIAPAGQQVYDFYTINGTEAGRITVDGSNFMAFSTGSSATERMRIDGSGNVAIGTTTTASRLRVAAGAQINAPVLGNVTNYPAFLSGPDTGFGLGIGTNNVDGRTWLQAQRSDGNAATYPITLNEAGGNVGIGTSSPVAQLDSFKASGYNDIRVRSGSNQAYLAADGTNAYVGTYSNIPLLVSTNNTERMRVTAGGDVGIGTSVPDVKVSIQDAGAGQITLKDSGGTTRAYIMTNGAIGTAPTNSLRIRGDSGVALGAVGSLAMFIDTSNNVGIGTTSPGVRLDVAGGSIRVGNTYAMTFRNAAGTGTATYTLQSDDNFVVYNASGTPISSFTQGSTNIAVYGSNGSNRMTVDSVNNVTHWAVNGSERARINSSGEFLVGTTSGGRTVCINAADNWIRQSNASRSWLIGMGTTSTFYIWDETGGGPRFWVDTSGSINAPNSFFLGSGANNDNKIEIGAGRTGNNFAYIDLIGDTTYTDYGLRLLRGNGGPNTGSELSHRGTGDFNITCYEAATMRLNVNGGTRMYIDSAGTSLFTGLIVGRTGLGSDVNSANDTGSFSVRGDTTKAASISFHRAGAYAMNMGLGTDAVFRIGGWSAVSNAFQMDGSGNLTMAGNVTAYSDARLKKDVETIDSALDLVSKMRGVRYTRIGTEKRGVGVIAQEMLEVVPEVVQQGVGDDDTLSVAYGNLVGVLIEAVKELTARVAELERK